MTSQASISQSAAQSGVKDHSERLRQEQTEQLFEHLGLGLIVTVANAGILAYVVRGDVGDAYIFGWFAAVLLVVFGRVILLAAYRCATAQSRTERKWKRWFDIGTLAMGLAWGASSIVVFSDSNVATQMFLGFVLGGMAAGAVSTLSIDCRTYLLFLVPSLLPFVVRLFAVGTEAHIGMGIMSLLFFCVLMTSGGRYQKALKSSLALRYANDDLVEELRAAVADAAEASRAKSLFLANMSHEIRTPMNGVFGMTDLLKRTALSQRQLRLVETIHQSAKTLLTIINDILDISRIEAGKLELDHIDFDLRHCIEGSVELFAEGAERKKIELTVFIANDVPEFTKGDPGRVRQVLVNVIGNAVKFTDKGRIAITACMVSDDDSGTGRVEIKVSDTGIGMDQSALARIQEPFIQGDSSINRRFGGTGLGLSISKHLVSMMNGELSIDSALGSGTTVTVAIPFETGLALAHQQRPEDVRLEGRRVLVVDDRDTNREILNSYLEDFGATVSCASSAGEALKMLTAARHEYEPFDVALLDCVMPGMDGLQLAEAIRADEDLATLPLVMITSLSWKGDSKAAREAGINEFMTKPIRRRDVLAAIKRSLAPEIRSGSNFQETGLTQFKGHVLIAEDNPVNQEVAVEFVTSFGCTTEVVSNGVEVLAAFDTFRFDLVLMDCQMPELDGFKATQKIREIEATRGLKRLPIVALTANAFDGDRQACLDAGMDGYVSKPFTESELEEALSQWLVKSHEEPKPADSLDLDVIANLSHSKPKLLLRMIEVYLRHSPDTVAGLKAGMEEQDAVKVQLNAHSLKSSSANVGATTLAELCKTIELEAKSHGIDKVGALVDKVCAEYRSVERALHHHLSEADLDIDGAAAVAVGRSTPDDSARRTG